MIYSDIVRRQRLDSGWLARSILVHEALSYFDSLALRLPRADIFQRRFGVIVFQLRNGCYLGLFLISGVGS